MVSDSDRVSAAVDAFVVGFHPLALALRKFAADFNRKFAATLHMHRHLHGLGPAEYARTLGISPRRYRQIERARLGRK